MFHEQIGLEIGRIRQPARPMKEHVIQLDLDVSASTLWSFKSGTGLDEHLAKGESQIFSVEEFEESSDSAGDKIVNRLSKLTFETNPVPKQLRSLVAVNEFAIGNRAIWFPAAWDASHPYSFEVILPVLTR